MKRILLWAVSGIAASALLYSLTRQEASTLWGLAYAVGGLFSVLWIANRPNSAQILHEHRDLTQRLETVESHIKLGVSQDWGNEVIGKMRQEAESLRAKIFRLERSHP